MFSIFSGVRVSRKNKQIYLLAISPDFHFGERKEKKKRKQCSLLFLFLGCAGVPQKREKKEKKKHKHKIATKCIKKNPTHIIDPLFRPSDFHKK